MTRLLAVLAALWASQAGAHEWYDPECCSVDDCSPVAVDVVRATAEGWLVQVGPGDHPYASKQIEVVIPYGHRKERRSQDHNFHLCLGRSGNVYCLYVPDFGA